MPAGPLVRIEDAGLGVDAQVRLVVSGVSAPDRLRAAWASSGAMLEVTGGRVRATTTVEALARAAGRALDSSEARALDRGLRTAVAAWLGPAPSLVARHRRIATDKRPQIMGVLNVTPDSFSDGGVLYPQGHPDAAADRAEALLAEGADLLDIGGESTRPGSLSVPEDEELHRVIPVLERLVSEHGDAVVCSIDTTKPGVAQAAIAAGAAVVNDVSGGRDPDLLKAVAASDCGYVLMHTRGTPADMRGLAEYDDVVAEVYEFLAAGLARCEDAGIDLERVVIDPGLGFAKTAEHSLALLRELRQFRGLGRPVMVGASRKSFLGALLDGAAADDRLEGSLACVGWSIGAGASLLRVHDVAASVRVARVARAIAAAETVWPAGG